MDGLGRERAADVMIVVTVRTTRDLELTMMEMVYRIMNEQWGHVFRLVDDTEGWTWPKLGDFQINYGD